MHDPGSGHNHPDLCNIESDKVSLHSAPSFSPRVTNNSRQAVEDKELPILGTVTFPDDGPPRSTFQPANLGPGSEITIVGGGTTIIREDQSRPHGLEE